MIAAVRAVNDVVQLQPARGSAARRLAPAAVAMPHETRNGGRNVLLRARRLRFRLVTDPLSIAFGARDRGSAHRNTSSGAVLPARSTALAHRQRDDVFRPARVLCAGVWRREGRLAERRDELVVIQARRVFLVDRESRLPQARCRGRRYLEPHDVHAHLGIPRVGGQVARAVVRDELLDLPEVLAGDGVAPRAFRRGRRDAAQLAHGREREGPRTQRGGHPRQRRERTRDPQPILRGTRAIPQHPLHVIERGDEAESLPDPQALGLA